MADYSKVDPGMVQFLNMFYAAEQVGFEAVGLENSRAMLDAFPDMVDLPAVEVGEVRDLEIAGAAGTIKARLYIPENQEANSPAMVFYHGGGWILGGIDSHDRPCRRICATANMPVLAVDYRLAPEHVFPAAIDDAKAAFHWACEHAGELGVDKSLIAVAGDSAGGNIAASISLSLRGDPLGEPAFQLLIYPSLQPFGRAQSHEQFADGYALDKADMKFFITSYAGKDAFTSEDPRLWPLLAEDHKGAAPAYIITAGHDPLQDDGSDYALALGASGVAAKHKSYPGMTHGFCSMTALSPVGCEALEDAASYLGSALREK
ncbi:MAG: alpha/beta hydrolase [Robiginitomaculum sp.]|nr:alpha/beta hydrolase [Robiginitomaculum sp.]